jgi:hypothetical protein
MGVYIDAEWTITHHHPPQGEFHSKIPDFMAIEKREKNLIPNSRMERDSFLR